MPGGGVPAGLPGPMRPLIGRAGSAQNLKKAEPSSVPRRAARKPKAGSKAAGEEASKGTSKSGVTSSAAEPKEGQAPGSEARAGQGDASGGPHATPPREAEQSRQGSTAASPAPEKALAKLRSLPHGKTLLMASPAKGTGGDQGPLGSELQSVVADLPPTRLVQQTSGVSSQMLDTLGLDGVVDGGEKEDDDDLQRLGDGLTEGLESLGECERYFLEHGEMGAPS